jgi:hypothetical protein
MKSQFSEVTAMIQMVQNRIEVWVLIRISGFIQTEFLDQLQNYGCDCQGGVADPLAHSHSSFSSVTRCIRAAYCSSR